MPQVRMRFVITRIHAPLNDAPMPRRVLPRRGRVRAHDRDRPEPAPGDQVIQEAGTRAIVDSEAAPMLDNAELDARREGDQVAFGLTTTAGGNSSPTSG